MKGINKILRLFLFGFIMFSIFSCKTASIINFESENFENFKNDTISLESLPEDFYFSRILTATCVDIVIFKFSKQNNFKELFAKNIVIEDDDGNVIFKQDSMKFKSYDSINVIQDCHYKTYSYEIPYEEFDRVTLRNYKTNCIILSFEIDGTKYSEKLKRDEKKYLVTRT